MKHNKFLLDTHTWIWWNARPDALSETVRGIIGKASPQNEIIISAASFWEFSKMIEKECLVLSQSPYKWIATALEMPGLKTIHISPQIALDSCNFPCSSLGDSFKQIIAATARQENAVILTQAESLHECRHLQTLW